LDSLNGADKSEDQSADESILLKWILGKKSLGMWIGLIWLWIGIDVGFCEHGNEPFGSI
jgi:hypothetical protein